MLQGCSTKYNDISFFFPYFESSQKEMFMKDRLLS